MQPEDPVMLPLWFFQIEFVAAGPVFYPIELQPIKLVENVSFTL